MCINSSMLFPDNIWKTDLDFVLSSYDRLLVLSFMTPPPTENTTLKGATTANSITPPSPTAQTLTLLSDPSQSMLGNNLLH